MQVSTHKDAVSLFERYAKGSDNNELKDWAGKTLPALQHHLEMAAGDGQEPQVTESRPCIAQVSGSKRRRLGRSTFAVRLLLKPRP